MTADTGDEEEEEEEEQTNTLTMKGCMVDMRIFFSAMMCSTCFVRRIIRFDSIFSA